MVIPQKEYSQLYNGQYAKLTTLQKSLDPRGENSSYLEATLKKHYPKVYKDMIQNDYILTGSQRIQDVLNEESNNEERQRKNMQMSKQLDEVVSGKQKLKRLSNPLRPIAQRYVDKLTLSLPFTQRQVFRSYLNTYVNRIPFYMKDRSSSDKATSTPAQTNRKRKRDDGGVKQRRPQTILTKLLSPTKLRSKKELKKKNREQQDRHNKTTAAKEKSAKQRASNQETKEK